jgi:hypothetical protein
MKCQQLIDFIKEHSAEDKELCLLVTDGVMCFGASFEDKIEVELGEDTNDCIWITYKTKDKI